MSQFHIKFRNYCSRIDFSFRGFRAKQHFFFFCSFSHKNRRREVKRKKNILHPKNISPRFQAHNNKFYLASFDFINLKNFTCFIFKTFFSIMYYSMRNRISRNSSSTNFFFFSSLTFHFFFSFLSQFFSFFFCF